MFSISGFSLWIASHSANVRNDGRKNGLLRLFTKPRKDGNGKSSLRDSCVSVKHLLHSNLYLQIYFEVLCEKCVRKGRFCKHCKITPFIRMQDRFYYPLKKPHL